MTRRPPCHASWPLPLLLLLPDFPVSVQCPVKTTHSGFPKTARWQQPCKPWPGARRPPPLVWPAPVFRATPSGRQTAVALTPLSRVHTAVPD
jgi:hypothetical protein